MKFSAKPLVSNEVFRAGHTWDILKVTEVSGSFYAIVMGPYKEKNLKVVILPAELSPGVYGCNKGKTGTIDLVRIWDLGHKPAIDFLASSNLVGT